MTKQETMRQRTMVLASVVAVLGAAALVHGVWLAWRPAGWMLAGLLIAAPAVCVAYDAFRER